MVCENLVRSSLSSLYLVAYIHVCFSGMVYFGQGSEQKNMFLQILTRERTAICCNNVIMCSWAPYLSRRRKDSRVFNMWGHTGGNSLEGNWLQRPPPYAQCLAATRAAIKVKLKRKRTGRRELKMKMVLRPAIFAAASRASAARSVALPRFIQLKPAIAEFLYYIIGKYRYLCSFFIL